MWRMQRPDGMSCHAVIEPRADGAVVTWYLNGHVLGYRVFDDWTAALCWSDRLQAQNWTVVGAWYRSMTTRLRRTDSP